MTKSIVAAKAHLYNARMLSSLLAAFACVITPPSARAVDGNGAAIAGAMSLPLEAGPVSSPSLPAPLAAEWTPLPDAPRATLARELFTPLDVECVALATPLGDCSTLASRVDDTIGSCHVLAPARGRTAVLARGRSRGASHRVAAGTIAPASELLVPDAHATPLLWPARLAFVPSFVAAPLRGPPMAAPPATPGRRIDRPPRA